MEPRLERPSVGKAKASVGGFLRVAWTQSGWYERTFVFLMISAMVVIVSVPILLFFLVIRHEIPGEVMLSFVLAAATGGAFYGSWIDPLLTAPILEEISRRSWASPKQVAYFTEYSRYAKAFGIRGRIRGTVAWGLATWSVYYTMLAVSIGFTLFFFPVLGSATPYYFAGVDAAVVLGVFVANAIKNRRRLLEAESRGFNLLKLYPRKGEGGSIG